MADRLFGTDGIRGIAGRWPLVPDFVRRIGLGAGRVLSRGRRGRSGSILVIRDTRRSGPWIQKALADGLGRAGFRVLDGGVLPTPAAAALVPRYGFAAGAVISASHNPAAFNGIKFFGPKGTKLPDGTERAMEREILSAGRVPAGRGGSGPFIRARRDYLDFLRSAWPKGLDLRGFSLALDCANGATSFLAAPLFRSLGARVYVLSARPDGLNINRNCGALHPEALSREVLRRRASLGVAFDGDGDRAMFVDEEGRVKNGDAVLLAAARHLKARGRLRNNTVAVTVMANLGLYRALEALDIRALETAVGDRWVWEGMVKSGAVLGGEQSGHIIFREFLPTGDGLLTALQVLAVVRSAGRPFSALTSLVTTYPQVLKNVEVREKKPLEKLPGFQRVSREVGEALGKTGRVLVRYSGTEPLLRIMVEGPDLKTIQAHADALAKAVRRDGL